MNTAGNRSAERPLERPRTTVLGAGAWGRALHAHLLRLGVDARLWARKDSISDALQGCELALIATPCAAFREMLTQLATHAPQADIVWACKGFDTDTSAPLDTIAAELSPARRAVLSGPTFAAELARGLPSAITVASSDETYAHYLGQCFHGESLRVYHLDDITGVQVAGALKNVYAIAAGISDGLGFGANARAALITRSLAELTRLGLRMGARAETFMGLAGMGDLVLTCGDDQSRNRRFGLAIAAGKTQQQALDEIGQVVEGRRTTQLALRLAEQYAVEMPIVGRMHAVLYANEAPTTAVRALLEREQRAEPHSLHPL